MIYQNDPIENQQNQFSKAFKELQLGKEFHGRSYDMTVSHTTIVFTRYIILEWIRRNKNDQKTFGISSQAVFIQAMFANLS